MNWTKLRRPAVVAALLQIGFFLFPGTLRADEATPKDYRYLDWISPAEIAKLPPDQRPKFTGMCKGAYISPTLSAGNPGQTKVHASADRFDTSADGKLLLEGDVLIQQGSRELRSDYVRLDRNSRETELTGHVVIRQPGMLIRGDHALINLNKKALDVSGTEYVVHQIHVHGRAGRIYNPTEKVLILDNSTYTTCEPSDNAWEIKAGEIKLNRESGWGQVKNATVKVKGVPIVYLPWWMFPIDDRRQSGFLFPIMGSSTTDGFRLGVPYYLNLAPNYDATLTPTYISRRGTLLEGEFRYLTPHTKGTIGAGYLPNDKQYDNRDRNLVTWHHEGHYGRLVNEVQYTEVGDIDYFNDLGTNLNTSAATHLDQHASLNYFGDIWRFNALLQKYQTIDATIAPNDLPYRKLPQLLASAKMPLPSWNPLEFNFNSEYVYFQHPDQNQITVADSADRVRLAGGVDLNLRRPWGYFVPTYTYRARYYNIHGGPLDNQEPDVTSYEFNLDSGLYFDRPLAFNNHSFIQTLEPRLYYLYVPYREQNELPTFDTAKNSFGFEQLFRDNRFTGGDRIGDADQVSLGVTSRFIDQNTGLERLNLSLGQIFYLKDRRVQLETTDPAETTTLSPFVARGYWLFNDDWTLRAETQFDSQVNNLDALVTGVAYRDKKGNLLNFNYNYYDNGAVTADPLAEKIKQTDLSFIWSVTQRWGLIARWGFDLNQRRSFDTLLGVEYESCCWRARLVNRRFLKESNDVPDTVKPQQGIFLQFELKGLGGIGGAVDGMLEESIPGYRERESLRSHKF